MAVLEAIEKAVHSMVVEGAIDGIWNFQDPKAGRKIIAKYLREKSPNMFARFDESGRLLEVRHDGKIREFRSKKPRRR